MLALCFDPNDPFPLFAEGAFTYPEEQLHSEKVDAWLDLRTQPTEEHILSRHSLSDSSPDEQHWVGLAVRSLLTPYTEIRRILTLLGLSHGKTLVDLGAGYGRVGFVLARHYPGVSFVGYECVPERVEEARRQLASYSPAITMELADIADPAFKPLLADCYFIYDFGSRSAIEKTLEDLRLIARKQPITVAGRGRSSRDAIERQHPWLSKVIAPVHFGHFSIYRSG